MAYFKANTSNIAISLFGFHFLLFMHLVLPNGGGSDLYLPQNSVAWIFISLISFLGIVCVFRKQKLEYTRVLLIFSFALVILVVPVFYKQSSDLPNRLIAMTALLFFYFSLIQLELNRKHKLVILYFILISATFQCLYVFFEIVKPIPESQLYGYKYSIRPGGVFQQPNVLASYLASSIPLSIILMSFSEGGETIKRALVLITVFISSFVLFVLQSRTGLIGASLAFILSIPLLIMKSRKLTGLIVLSLSLGVTAGLLADIKEGARSAESFQRIEHRLNLYSASFDMILEKPFTGFGYGNFERSYREFIADNRANYNEEVIFKAVFSHPHNEFLYWGIEGGVLSTIGLLVLVIGGFYLLKGKEWSLILAIIGLLCPIAFHTQTELPFYLSITHGIIFLFFIYCFDFKVERIFFSINKKMKLLLYPVPVFSVVFMLSNLYTIYVFYEYERNGKKDPSVLSKVVNPMTLDLKFEGEVNYLMLYKALKENDRVNLINYISWSEKAVNKWPRKGIYVNRIIALKALGKNDQAKIVENEMKHLFPD
ncbi:MULTISPECIES: Wzy polymerase domain-containing protein [unclassified Endozoicomonas]|uniref:PglL family O-oligosaccharyltransferase n=1 Tax=unclassified Endozoicomonas TaxID=2644528 RepID=UPI003BB7AB55